MARILITPDFILVLLLFISFFTLNCCRRFSRRLFAFVLLNITVLTFFPVGEWIIYPLETTFKTNPEIPADVDGVIMLSGGEEAVLSRMWNQIEFDSAVERNIYFMKLMRGYPNAAMVFSGGGIAEYQGYSEKLVRQLAQAFGLDDQKITFETNSKSTIESVKNLNKLIKPLKKDKWVVITSAWHMPRAKLLFNNAGWEIIPFPVDHLSHKENLFRVKINFSENLKILRLAVKEWIGIFVYKYLN